MAKKKQTRDVPLPSSDGMFGGPGDPKKKTSYPRQYTAKDSANYMKQIGDISQYERHIVKEQKGFEAGPMYKKLHGMEDKRNDNPFHDTYRIRQGAKSRNKK